MSYDAECYCATNEGLQCVFCEMETGDRLRCVAKNLAIGAGLCAAFDLGLYNTDAGNVHPSVNWRPGCRWPAP